MSKLIFLFLLLCGFANGQVNRGHKIDTVTSLSNISNPLVGMEVICMCDTSIHWWNGNQWLQMQDSIHSQRLANKANGLNPPIQVVNNVFDAKGAGYYFTGFIGSNVTIKNAIISCSRWTQVCDLTDTLINCKFEAGFISTEFFNASSDTDKALMINKTFNESISNNDPANKTIKCVKSYTTYTPLLEYFIYAGHYSGFAINFEGDGDFWDKRQTITYIGYSYAFGVQHSKGGSIKGLYFLQAGIGGGLYSNGIVIDPIAPVLPDGGTTGFKVQDCWVDHFFAAFVCSPTAVALNGDNLLFINNHCGKCVYGFEANESQNKGITISGFYTWDSCMNYLFNIVFAHVDISHVRIANFSNSLINANVGGWNTLHIDDVYAERLNSIGSFVTVNSIYNFPVNLENFDLRLNLGTQNIITSDSYNVTLSNSELSFYGTQGAQMFFSGKLNFHNVDLGSSINMDSVLIKKI